MTPLAKSILVGALLIISGVGVTVYMFSRHSPSTPESCPHTPLLCPDGSLVNRRERECNYDACSNAGPITGELVRVADGFQLRIAAPPTTTQEVSYALPLRVADTEEFAALVGKNITVYGSFMEGNVFAIGHYSLAGNSDPTVGQVRVGQTVFINGVRITLLNITNDSRCPMGVACVRAGSVAARVALKSDTDSATTTLESGAAPFGFDAFLVSITGVQPDRTVETPAQSAYVLTFKVANTSAGVNFDARYGGETRRSY